MLALLRYRPAPSVAEFKDTFDDDKLTVLPDAYKPLPMRLPKLRTIEDDDNRNVVFFNRQIPDPYRAQFLDTVNELPTTLDTFVPYKPPPDP